MMICFKINTCWRCNVFILKLHIVRQFVSDEKMECRQLTVERHTTAHTARHRVHQ